MPANLSDRTFEFPPIHTATEEGIVAVGGDLCIERLLSAYRQGIFPWYNNKEPILWWSPDPRFVLFPEKLKISRSLQRIINQKRFKITFDSNFEYVITNCKEIKRPLQRSTWINNDMKNAYIKLHHAGYAHSVEVWEKEKIVGGLYGISLGNCFFGESMFTHKSNASKVGFVILVEKLKKLAFSLIDCQVYTDHLASFGAELISRTMFIEKLNEGLKHKDIIGNWDLEKKFK